MRHWSSLSPTAAAAVRRRPCGAAATSAFQSIPVIFRGAIRDGEEKAKRREIKRAKNGCHLFGHQQHVLIQLAEASRRRAGLVAPRAGLARCGPTQRGGVAACRLNPFGLPPRPVHPSPPPRAVSPPVLDVTWVSCFPACCNSFRKTSY